MQYNSTIFREYDIRGKVSVDYDLDFSKNLGKAFALFVLEKLKLPKVTIALGKDARHSSTEILKAFSEGVLSTGCDVYKLSLVTSPLSYFSSFQNKSINATVMITGSHNPPEYNGFKFTCNKKGLGPEEIKSLESRLQQEIPSQTETGNLQDYDIITPYCKRLSEEFNFDHSAPKFVVDCGNGAAGSAARRAYQACGLEPEFLFEKPDGDFPNHHPDPTLEENLVDLKEYIKNSDAEFGIGYDGDADRIVVVSKKLKTFYTDQLMLIYAQSILDKYPGASIIADVKCSDFYFNKINDWGGKAIMWKTGHSLIKQKVKEENSPFGGEFSGHIFFNDRFYGFDDALYCSLRLVEILKDSGKSLDDFLEEIPKSFSSPEIRLEVGESKKYELVKIYKDKISEHAVSVNEIDGVRARFKEGWALVRVSNTQPAITLRFEASSEKDLYKIKEQAYQIMSL